MSRRSITSAVSFFFQNKHNLSNTFATPLIRLLWNYKLNQHSFEMKKKTLIIGGYRGIGKSIYETIKKRGDIVFCICRSKIKKKNFISADITKKEGINLIKNFFKKEKIDTEIEEPGEVDKTIKPYKWSQNRNGFTIKHQSKEKLPKKIEIKVSYASARELKKAKYEAWDFDFNDPSMQVINKNCNCSKLNNKISIDNLKKDFELQVSGFDNREPEVTIDYE